MTGLLTVANWLLPMLYLALLIDYGAGFLLRTTRRGLSAWLPAACGLHVAFLVLLAVHLGRPVPVGIYEVLSVLAAFTAGVYWVIERASGERRTGAFVLLAAFLMQYTASVFLPGAVLRPGAAEPAGRAAGYHIIPFIVAYISLTLSAIYGLLHLLARRGLKRHRFGLLFDRLPSLDLLGKMNWHAMLTGLAFMTLAMASGAVMLLVGPREAAGGLEAKVWVMIMAGALAWVLCAGAAAGKWIGRWSAARVCLISVLGFLVVLGVLVASILLS